jgi:hypothetical protein
MGGWIIPLLFALSVLAVFASFAKGTSAAPAVQRATPTMTPIPVNGQTAGVLDALLLQMQQTMQSLQGMLGQLDQQNALLPTTLSTATPVANLPTPTAAPAANLPAVRAQLQDINQALVPLMKRIQADLQGNPSASEIASVRGQVNLVQIRLAYLVNHLQTARGGSPVEAATPTMAPMPGGATEQPTATPQANQPQAPVNTQRLPADQQQTQAMLIKLDQLMQQTQSMLQQLQTQQAGANSGGANTGAAMSGGTDPGQMNGMNMPMPTSTPIATSDATSNTMPGMSNSSASMDSMMTMIDQMMSMMDNMMQMMDNTMGTR